MMQKQICLNLNHRLTLTNSQNSQQRIMQTKTVILTDNKLLGLNNFM